MWQTYPSADNHSLPEAVMLLTRIEYADHITRSECQFGRRIITLMRLHNAIFSLLQRSAQQFCINVLECIGQAVNAEVFDEILSYTMTERSSIDVSASQ